MSKDIDFGCFEEFGHYASLIISKFFPESNGFTVDLRDATLHSPVTQLNIGNVTKAKLSEIRGYTYTYKNKTFSLFDFCQYDNVLNIRFSLIGAILYAAQHFQTELIVTPKVIRDDINGLVETLRSNQPDFKKLCFHFNNKHVDSPVELIEKAFKLPFCLRKVKLDGSEFFEDVYVSQVLVLEKSESDYIVSSLKKHDLYSIFNMLHSSLNPYGVRLSFKASGLAKALEENLKQNNGLYGHPDTSWKVSL